MSPIDTAVRQRTLQLSIIDRQLVQYFGLYRTRSAHSRTIGLQFYLHYVVFIVL